jgi:hypothetical protein
MYSKLGVQPAFIAALSVKGTPMAAEKLVFASPKPATTLAKIFGDRASEVKVDVRASKDVPRFLAKLIEARRKSAQSKLRFK